MELIGPALGDVFNCIKSSEELLIKKKEQLEAVKDEYTAELTSQDSLKSEEESCKTKLQELQEKLKIDRTRLQQEKYLLNAIRSELKMQLEKLKLKTGLLENASASAELAVRELEQLASSAFSALRIDGTSLLFEARQQEQLLQDLMVEQDAVRCEIKVREDVCSDTVRLKRKIIVALEELLVNLRGALTVQLLRLTQEKRKQLQGRIIKLEETVAIVEEECDGLECVAAAQRYELSQLSNRARQPALSTSTAIISTAPLLSVSCSLAALNNHVPGRSNAEPGYCARQLDVKGDISSATNRESEQANTLSAQISTDINIKDTGTGTCLTMYDGNGMDVQKTPNRKDPNYNIAVDEKLQHSELINDHKSQELFAENKPKKITNAKKRVTFVDSDDNMSKDIENGFLTPSKKLAMVVNKTLQSNSKDHVSVSPSNSTSHLNSRNSSVSLSSSSDVVFSPARKNEDSFSSSVCESSQPSAAFRFKRTELSNPTHKGNSATENNCSVTSQRAVRFKFQKTSSIHSRPHGSPDSSLPASILKKDFQQTNDSSWGGRSNSAPKYNFKLHSANNDIPITNVVKPLLRTEMCSKPGEPRSFDQFPRRDVNFGSSTPIRTRQMQLDRHGNIYWPSPQHKSVASTKVKAVQSNLQPQTHGPLKTTVQPYIKAPTFLQTSRNALQSETDKSVYTLDIPLPEPVSFTRDSVCKKAADFSCRSQGAWKHAS